MKVGLIITTYNWTDALVKVLNSVKLQSYLPDEIVVCDDGSRIECKKYILEFQKLFPYPFKYLWNEDKGFRAAFIRNKGILELSDDIDYIILIDGDMILDKNFVKDHLKNSQKNYFIQGGRVLISKKRTNDILNQHSTTNKFNFFTSGLLNKKNTIYMPFLTKFFFKKTNQNLDGIRTCNMSFWREDLFEVNGFNEDFVGWGREDTELAVRLFNKGKFRKNIKFSGIAYHLHHEEKSRSNISVNDGHLCKSINSKSTWCNNGLFKVKK